MLSTDKLAAAASFALFAYDQYSHFKLRNRHDKVVQNAAELYKYAESINAQMQYLVDVLNRNDVKLDEFDLIALPNIKQVSKS
jgi:hypothetical protein